MLLANLSKSDSLSRLLGLKRAPVLALSPSSLALDQLTHLFNRGANKGYNSASDYDYLAYLFADLAKVCISFPTSLPVSSGPLVHVVSPRRCAFQLMSSSSIQFPPIATYLTSPSPNDPLSLPPLTLLTPFTTYPSTTRRLGLSSLLYNLSLSLPSSGIPPLLSPPLSILPQLLLPLCGPDPTFSETEIESLLPELQLLGNDHHREPDFGILKTLVETVYVLVGKGGKEVRTGLKEAGTYLVVRELHLEIEDEAVRAACEKVVDLLMIDEEDGRVSSLVSERQKDEEEEEKAKAITKPLNPADPAKESRVSEEIPKTTTTTITASTPSTQEETTQTSTKLPPPNYSSPIPIPPLPVTIINKDDNNNNNNNNNDSEDEEEEEDNNRIVDIF